MIFNTSLVVASQRPSLNSEKDRGSNWVANESLVVQQMQDLFDVMDTARESRLAQAVLI